MTRRTMFAAAAAEHSRFGATTGILMELEDNKAAMVATDGRRLALGPRRGPRAWRPFHQGPDARGAGQGDDVAGTQSDRAGRESLHQPQTQRSA